jgi:hypothetical protein
MKDRRMMQGEVMAHRVKEEDVCVLNLHDDGLVEVVEEEVTDQVNARWLALSDGSAAHRTLSTLFVSDTQAFNYAAWAGAF